MIIEILIVCVWIAISILSIPVATFVTECLIACLVHSKRSQVDEKLPRPACAIVIPAHNEESGLVETLASLFGSVDENDRVVVVADNCTDSTAEVAKRAGAEVVQRVDPAHRGKGFAMQYGVDAIRDDPREVVVFLDADCQFTERSLDNLVRQTIRDGRATQAKYLMNLPNEVDASVGSAVSQFAVVVKNWVRPRGLARLNIPVPLTGSGMAFPWDEVSSLTLGTSNIVEDMSLGCELARRNRGATFCESAEVYAMLPNSFQASNQQRRRWEHGHLDTIRRQVPALCVAALRMRRLSTLAVACDLAVPPLTLLMLALSVTWLACVLLVTHQLLPLVAISLMMSCVLVAVVLSAFVFSSDRQLWKALFAIPRYILTKLPIYFSFFFFGRQRQWLRTAR